MKSLLIVLMILLSTQVYSDPKIEELEAFESLARSYYVYKNYTPICVNGYLFMVAVEGGSIVQFYGKSKHGEMQPPQPVECKE